jgi:hypothetical protein
METQHEISASEYFEGAPQQEVDAIFAEIASCGASSVFLQAAQSAAQAIKDFDAHFERDLKTKRLTDEESAQVCDTFNELSRLCANFQRRFLAAKEFDAISTSDGHTIQ